MCEALREQWLLEESAPFSGWDFSRLNGRVQTGTLPWDYREWVLRYLTPASRLLDMGTGGGEFLITLGHPGALTAVTEGWPPNLALCRERLSPLGITVEESDGLSLPFGDDAFDIVVNRHESYSLPEVRRVLRPGGVFVTQQVGGRNNESLREKLLPGLPLPFPGFDLASQSAAFGEAGFSVLCRNEAFPRMVYHDVGAVVYFAKNVVWDFPGFSVERCFDGLCALQRELERNGRVTGREHRFILSAVNRK